MEPQAPSHDTRAPQSPHGRQVLPATSALPRLERFRAERGIPPTPRGAHEHAAARLEAIERFGVPATQPAAPSATWRPLGPFAVAGGNAPGRVTAVAVDPSDPEHLLVGTPGGVWESRDHGGHWRPRSDQALSLPVGALAFDPSDPSLAYAATGEGDSLAAEGSGVLGSRDGGATWRPLATWQLAGCGVHALVVDPTDGRHLLAGTNVGLIESRDAGATWRRRLRLPTWSLSAGMVRLLHSLPLGPGGLELLAGCAGGLYRSLDGGATWEPVELPRAPGQPERVAVSHSPIDPAIAYVFASGEGAGHLWRRDLPGGPFRPLRLPADLHTQLAWYGWVAHADPGDPDAVYLGARDLHRGAPEADGRWSWVNLTARPSGGVPGVQHALAFAPADPAGLWAATDGGLFHSPDGGRSWHPRGAGLAVAELDGLASHDRHPDWLLAGARGCGLLRYEGGEVWRRVGLGDGGATAAGGACYHGGTAASLEGELARSGSAEPGTWASAGPATATTLPAPPLAARGDLVVQGGAELLLSADAGRTWTALPLAEGERASALAIGDAATVWAGGERGGVHRVERAAGEWAAVPVSPPRDAWVTAIAVDPSTPGRLWLARSAPAGAGGRVLRSGDGGASWTDVSGGLPAVPVSALAPDPDRRGAVFAATDLGVYRSGDDGTTWWPFSSGLPSAPVTALALHARARRLRAALRGRGAWEAPLDPEAPRPRLVMRGRLPDPRRADATVADPDRIDPWWVSPDVKVTHGAAAPGPEAFDDLPEASGWLGARGHPGAPGWNVHVRVHNHGAVAARDVHLRVRATAPALGLPEPGHGAWRTVGEARIAAVEPGRSAVATVEWAGAAPATLLVDVDGASCLRGLTVVGDPERGLRLRAVRLDLWGGRGSDLLGDALARELVAGLVLGPRLAEAARAAGCEPGRVPEGCRPDLVTLVQSDLALTERLDLATAYRPPPAARWLAGAPLRTDRPEPLILLLHDGTPPGDAMLLTTDSGLPRGGHSLRCL